MAKYAFKFLSGKYQGGEFPLPDVGELIIGRAAELDMVLIEDMVSRRHARLVAANGNLTLTDLGSTNGTFVNGEKIKQAKLAVNDRVLVGTSILKLVDASAGASEGTQVDVVPQAGDKPAIAAMMAGLADRPAPSANTMSGDLEEVPLPDLLQLFSTNKKTGSIAIDGPQPARIVLKDGALLQVSLLQNPNIKPMQALCKMLTWTSGAFKFDALKDTSDIPAAFDTSTENALIEAMRLNDESKREAQQLAAGRGKVTLVMPLGPKLTALSKDALEVLQLAINLQEVKKIAAATSDSIATIEQVRDLIGSGYLHLS
jgi:pSer/pThr/pTyr-binding forkhead associated (FHA) protein